MFDRKLPPFCTRNILVPVPRNCTQLLCGRPAARRTVPVFLPVTQHFSSCEGNSHCCSSTRKSHPAAWGEGEGRRHRFVTYLDERGKIPFRAQQGLQWSISSQLLSPGSTGAAGADCYTWERWRGVREAAKTAQKINSNLTTLPLRTTVLAIMIKCIPLMLKQNLHKIMCLRRASFPSPPSSTRTGLFYRSYSQKCSKTIYKNTWHNNLCEASRSCGLCYVLHFSPTKVRHHTEWWKCQWIRWCW